MGAVPLPPAAVRHVLLAGPLPGSRGRSWRREVGSATEGDRDRGAHAGVAAVGEAHRRRRADSGADRAPLLAAHRAHDPAAVHRVRASVRAADRDGDGGSDPRARLRCTGARGRPRHRRPVRRRVCRHEAGGVVRAPLRLRRSRGSSTEPRHVLRDRRPASRRALRDALRRVARPRRAGGHALRLLQLAEPRHRQRGEVARRAATSSSSGVHRRVRGRPRLDRQPDLQRVRPRRALRARSAPAAASACRAVLRLELGSRQLRDPAGAVCRGLHDRRPASRGHRRRVHRGRRRGVHRAEQHAAGAAFGAGMARGEAAPRSSAVLRRPGRRSTGLSEGRRHGHRADPQSARSASRRAAVAALQAIGPAGRRSRQHGEPAAACCRRPARAPGRRSR